MKDLTFCLIPSGMFPDLTDASDVADEGWSIVITDSSSSDCNGNGEDDVNFGPVVTPPFRSNLTFDIFGWEFRNKENTGAYDDRPIVPRTRYFNFLFNRKDFEIVWHGDRCAEWKIPEDCAFATQTTAGGEVFIPHSRARFTITEIELGNLVPNKYAWIEYMEFKVEIYLPAE